MNANETRTTVTLYTARSIVRASGDPAVAGHWWRREVRCTPTVDFGAGIESGCCQLCVDRHVGQRPVPDVRGDGFAVGTAGHHRRRRTARADQSAAAIRLQA